MHLRWFFFPRGLFLQIGRNEHDYRTIGIGWWRFPFAFITWRTVIITMHSTYNGEPVPIPFHW